MASYFDELNIRTTRQQPQGYNIDTSDFMNTSTSARSTVPEEDHFMQVIRQVVHTFLLGGFRQQNSGDYVQEEFLDNLISQLLEESQASAKGPPPASDRFIKALPNIPPTAIASEEQCIICKDDLHTSTCITKMPCGHLYDKECLVPWLKLHNTCPMCRLSVESEEQVRQEEEEAQRDWMYA
ncbi:hypothetical protein BZG36_03373 [Bifiguratus adelaidae]|uniref:RING-type domain-containing protein n=1 Tax=Bifiguratus adelaidae TaxID=1938954 RepID=A0A261XY06_9FUNG|nr:hypothetical protein BZG36_03373 [Bifiguratus adelaidae]